MYPPFRTGPTSPQLPFLQSVARLLALLLTGLLWACKPGPSATLEQQQAENLRLTKALHTHLNHRDWQAIGSLCAKTVLYRGRTTRFAPVDVRKADFLTHYRTALNADRPGVFEVRQLYPAGSHHIIAEGIVTGISPPTALPVCLIYTIEDQHITRLYMY